MNDTTFLTLCRFLLRQWQTVKTVRNRRFQWRHCMRRLMRTDMPADGSIEIINGQILWTAEYCDFILYRFRQRLRVRIRTRSLLVFLVLMENGFCSSTTRINISESGTRSHLMCQQRRWRLSMGDSTETTMESLTVQKTFGFPTQVSTWHSLFCSKVRLSALLISVPFEFGYFAGILFRQRSTFRITEFWSPPVGRVKCIYTI